MIRPLPSSPICLSYIRPPYLFIPGPLPLLYGESGTPQVGQTEASDSDMDLPMSQLILLKSFHYTSKTQRNLPAVTLKAQLEGQ